MNVSVSPAMLVGMKDNSHFHWKDVVGELIDNSFDAGAKRVSVQFGPPKTFCVSDDGRGCGNMERMLTIGDHYNTKATLGRYGVGLKDAACWLWGEMRINTETDKTAHKAVIEWGKLAAQASWNIPDPEAVAITGNTGTTLTFRNIHRSFPDYKKMIDDISYFFAPALWGGCQIVMGTGRKKPIAIAPWTLPEMTNVIEDTFQIEGKQVKIRVGIVKEGVENKRMGFTYCHGHRVLMNTAAGAKGHSVSRIAGTVELGKGWTLSRNKDSVLDKHFPDLEAAIYYRCGNIIHTAEEQSQRIESSALANKVTDGLKALMEEKRKESRPNKGDSSGTVKPKATGVKRRRAANTKPGDKVMNALRSGSVRMEWDPSMNGELGRVDLLGGVIYLSPNHKRLAYHKANRNHDALIDACMALFANKVVQDPQREMFPAMASKTDFVDAWSYAMNAAQDGNA